MNFPGRHIALLSVLTTSTIASFATPAVALRTSSINSITPNSTATLTLPSPSTLEPAAAPTTLANKRIFETQLITPGKRVGMISFGMSYRDLVTVFGKKRLKDSVTYGREGTGKWPATIVDPGKGYKIKLTWANSRKTKIKRMTIGKGGEKWRTADGIGIGTNLSALNRQIGAFKIPGLDWTYGNRVLTNNPKLKGMSLRLATSRSALRSRNYGSVIGDQILKSTDPRLSGLGLKIARIELYPAKAKPHQVHKSFLIRPGKNVGPVRFNSTYATLVRQFGRQNLKSTVTYGPEGMGKWPATIVNVGPGQRVKVTWKDAKKTKITHMTIGKDGYAWRTADGIGVGLEFRHLKTKLGKFKVPGFGWDYGNRVLSRSPKIKGLSLQIAASQAAIKRNPKTYQSVLGDQTIQSTDRRLSRLGLQVNQIQVWAPLQR